MVDGKRDRKASAHGRAPSRLGRAAVFCALSMVAVLGTAAPRLAAEGPRASRQMVILDTDIGDDIDDAFALALALNSPELQILQVNADFGDTPLRARLLQRFLAAAGNSEIPVGTGPQTPASNNFTQRRYAEGGAAPPARDAVQSTLELIRKQPGKITLIALGPCTDIGAMIDRDPHTFRRLKRVVMMGGSVRRGYRPESSLGSASSTAARNPMASAADTPDAEWNIQQDIAGARKLLASGVPLFLMPLDATQLRLEKAERKLVLEGRSPLSGQLRELYRQWGQGTPVLYDPVAVAYSIAPGLCPVTPLHLEVNASGYTRIFPGRPNASVCLRSGPDAVFRFLLPRLTAGPR